MALIENKIPEIPGNGKFEPAGEIQMKFHGMLQQSVEFIERNQMCEVELWKKFVHQFRVRIDSQDLLWRCEYWGKMMRGACMVLQYTKDEGFYRIVEASARDMLTTQDQWGRMSTYEVENEFESWDLWGRKYVLLGFQYFLEICKDKALAQTILTALCRHADYIVAHIGNGEGQKEICKATRHWKGLNSCSILEPMVRLYRLTGDEKYLKFGEYIISTGFIDGGNLIELAYENKVAPHDYPVVKAYEMMSCFEGLLHYYRITGKEEHKVTLLNFGKRILEGELSIIGCSGCTHELFDHTAVRQTQTDYKGVVQETCVVVTWMRFAQGLLELTGDVAFADAIEQSFYNCYLGSFNTRRALYSNYPKKPDVPQVMPFDSYNPLTASRRGRVCGGYNVFPDGSFYGCCACIGAAGSGMMPRFALLKNQNGLILNFYEKGKITAKTPSGQEITLTLETSYPLEGEIFIAFDLEKEEEFTFTLRIPNWCKNATVSVDGKTAASTPGYFSLTRRWKKGDEVILNLPLEVKKVLPPADAVNADLFAAYQRGPLVLAADARISDPAALWDVPCDENGTVPSTWVYCPEIPDAHLCVAVETTQGPRYLIDYASAGKTWKNDSACAPWLPCKEE